MPNDFEEIKNKDEKNTDDLIVKTPKPEQFPEDGRPQEWEELPPDPIASVRTHDHDGQNSVPIKLRNVSGFFEVVSAVPTHKPKNAYEQIKLYVSGATYRIYFYDYKGKAWRNVS